MSEAEDSRLYGLMEIAESQQAAVQTTLEGLAAERAALRQEREAVRQERDKLTREMQKLQHTLEIGVRAAARSAVTDSLAEAAEAGVKAVQVATQPLLGQLAGVTASAGQAEVALRKIVLWASWRVLGRIVAGLTTLMLLVLLADHGVLWWDTQRIAAAQIREAQLQADVAKLEANRDSWVKAGMLQRLTNCTPGNRPCIRVDEGAGSFGSQADYRVIQGY